MTSAPEAEIAAMYINSKTTISLRITLHELNHPQPSTDIRTDNNIAESFAHSNIKQRKLKTVSMNFYWIQDKQEEKIINVNWCTKLINIADYFTKHHSPPHHQAMRSLLLH